MPHSVNSPLVAEEGRGAQSKARRARQQHGDGDWSATLQDIFGPHTIDMNTESHTPEVEAGRSGLLRYWRIRHGPLRLVAGKRTVRDTLKTGTFLLLFVDEGAAEIEFFNRGVSLGEGDAMLLTAVEPVTLSTGAHFSGSWVELPIWWLVELFGGGLQGARERLGGQLASTVLLRVAFAQLCASSEEANVQDMVDLFGDVLRRCLIIAGRGMKEEEGQIRRITLFIALNYRQEGLSPKDAARSLGCSVSSIHKSCATTGTTFGGMLATMRLSVAAFRLARDSQRISEIAFDCGFASVSHFCHAFKTFHGVSPKSMRSRHLP